MWPNVLPVYDQIAARAMKYSEFTANENIAALL